MTYFFTRDHTLDRVKYKAGDALRTDRVYNVAWLIQQGVPLRPVDEVIEVKAPQAVLEVRVPRPAFVAPASRFGCCGWKK